MPGRERRFPKGPWLEPHLDSLEPWTPSSSQIPSNPGPTHSGSWVSWAWSGSRRQSLPQRQPQPDLPRPLRPILIRFHPIHLLAMPFQQPSHRSPGLQRLRATCLQMIRLGIRPRISGLRRQTWTHWRAAPKAAWPAPLVPDAFVSSLARETQGPGSCSSGKARVKKKTSRGAPS